MEDVLNDEIEATKPLSIGTKICMATLIVVAGSFLNSLVGALLAGVGVYFALRAVRTVNGHERWLLVAASIIGLNVAVTTLWYGMIGNYADPALAPVWSKFDCSYSGGDDVYCPSYLTDERDEIFKRRGVTPTIIWWATGSALNQGEPSTHHNIQGLAATYRFPSS